MPVPSWVPNAISAARVALVPVWLAAAESVRANRLAEDPSGALLPPALLLVLGLSDILDGFIARRFGLTSRLGELLDASADKLAQWTFVGYLAFRGPPVWSSIPVVFFGLVLGRDALLTTGYLVMRARSAAVDTHHRLHGKVSSVLLFSVVLSTVLALPSQVTRTLLYASTAAILYSTVRYLLDGASDHRR